MTYEGADVLVAQGINISTTWESVLDYQLVQEILGHSISKDEWSELVDSLDDVVFETVMSFKK